MELTIEEINKAKQYLSNEGYGTGSNFTINIVANLMAEWAVKKQQLKKEACLDIAHSAWIQAIRKSLEPKTEDGFSKWFENYPK